MEFHLMRPEWLWSLLPAALLTFLLWRLRRRSGSWSSVIDPELLPYLVGGKTGERTANLLPLLLVGWVLAALAASGPSWQKIPQPIHQKQDALVLVLDLSYSMKSGDLAPSRLDRARQKLMDLLKQRREGQTGLIAYAGDAHIVTPLTDDVPTIANLLPALGPDMMPVPGSNPGAAIAQAVELMHSAGIRQGRILLVTDGVTRKDRNKVEKALSGSGMQLGVMGVGTATGAPIPLPRGGFLKDGDGTIVMPGLDAGELRALAESTGGRYVTMRIDDSDLAYLLSSPLLADATQTLALDRTADTWHDQGYLLILCLLPLALGLFRRGWVLCLLPVLFLAQPPGASAGPWQDLWFTPDQQGQQALQRGDSEKAAELFDDPDWAGTAAYRGEDYEAAVEHFSTGDSADSWYNRGNALARAGRLDEAIEAYRESLTRQPDQVDARENLELLEQLKQQQEQQQQDSGSGQQEQDQEQQDQEQQGEQQGSDRRDQQQQGQQDQQQAGDQGSPEQQQQHQPPPQDDQSGENGDGDQQQVQPAAEQQAQQRQQAEAEADATQHQRAEAARVDPEQQERDQAMEQWLRRVPDDPSGLLREKFRYESRRRQEQGQTNDNESYW